EREREDLRDAGAREVRGQAPQTTRRRADRRGRGRAVRPGAWPGDERVDRARGIRSDLDRARPRGAAIRLRAAEAGPESEDRVSFGGFPKETVRFLSGLRAHNDRDWFEAHRSDYQQFFLARAVAFAEALGPRLRKIEPDVNVEPKVNGSIMR